MRVLVPVASAVLWSTLFACTPGATSDCETYCSHESALTPDYDCSSLCESAQKLADDSGCDGAFASFMSCAANVTDASAVSDGVSCTQASEAFSQCIAPFCAIARDLAECQAAIPFTGN